MHQHRINAGYVFNQKSKTTEIKANASVFHYNTKWLAGNLQKATASMMRDAGEITIATHRLVTNTVLIALIIMSDHHEAGGSECFCEQLFT